MEPFAHKDNFCLFSSKTGEGLPELVSKIKRCLYEDKRPATGEDLLEINPVTQTHERKPSIFRDTEGNYIVRCGQKLKSRIAGEKTPLSVWKILEGEGVYRELEEAGIKKGDKISIGSKVFEWGTK